MSNNRPHIQPLALSAHELSSIISMCEFKIAYDDTASRMYGLDRESMIDSRAAAALIQHKCKNEMVRQQAVAQQREEQAKSDEKAQGALHQNDSSIVTTPPQPVSDKQE